MAEKLMTSKELGVYNSVTAIELAEIAEGKAIMAYREESDPDIKASHKEDAYLQALIQVREGRLMGKADYDSEKVEACTGQSYDDLFLPEYEDYSISVN